MQFVDSRSSEVRQRGREELRFTINTAPIPTPSDPVSNLNFNKLPFFFFPLFFPPRVRSVGQVSAGLGWLAGWLKGIWFYFLYILYSNFLSSLRLVMVVVPLKLDLYEDESGSSSGRETIRRRTTSLEEKSTKESILQLPLFSERQVYTYI